MRKASVLPLLAFVAFGLAAGAARAQDVCDGAASGTCNRFCAEGDSTAEVEASINGAAAGQTICLRRGSVFSAADGLDLTTTAGTQAAKITICASTNGSSCTDSGGANPVIRVSGGNAGVDFGNNVDHLVFRNVDVDGGGGGDGYYFGQGANNITIEGGTVSDFANNISANPFDITTPASGIQVGTCANPLTITRATAQGIWGWFANSKMSVIAFDNGTNGVFDHNLYLSSGDRASPVATNLTIECSDLTDSSVTSGGVSVGSFIHFAGRHDGLVIRDNVFHDDRCDTWVLDFDTAYDISPEYFRNVEIYSNLFKTQCPNVIEGRYIEGSSIYNNVFWSIQHNDNNYQSVIRLLDTNAGSARAQTGGHKIFNNTFYCDATNCPDNFIQIAANQDNANAFYNNLFVTTSDSSLTLFATACDRFGGAGGAEFDNNFVYTPNDSSPGMLSCGSGSGNSTSFNTNPQLTNPAGGNFKPQQGSPLLGAGRSAGAPIDDFDHVTRPLPPAIGAFEFAAAPADPVPGPPSPPVLLE